MSARSEFVLILLVVIFGSVFFLKFWGNESPGGDILQNNSRSNDIVDNTTVNDINRSNFIDGSIEFSENELSYSTVSDLIEINGKLAYVGVKGGKKFIVYEGKELGEKYDIVYSPVEINGKIAYAAKKEGKYLIVYGGQESKYYDEVTDPVEIDGKLVFAAKRDGKWYLVSEK